MRSRIAVTFVIMAGGRGKRLRSLVSAARPKVCLSLDGKRTLLQATIDRLRPVWPTADWLIVTTQGQADIIRRHLPAGLRRALLVEPQIKNTAACLTLAAATVAARNPQRVMVAVPADHWVEDEVAYRRSVRTAIHAAVRQQTIAMIGIPPTRADTQLGYLCAGRPLHDSTGSRVFRLASFVEKPPQAHAARLAKQPNTYWNQGSFIATADRFLRALKQWLPDHVQRLVPPPRTIRAAYRGLRPVSFDHGVMNRLQEGIIVEGLFAWIDVGTAETWDLAKRRYARARA
jgi:mannose-1-phosphate guanylyltransferase